MMHCAYIALGANLGPREATLAAAARAIEAHPATSVFAVSSYHETAAVVPGDPAAAAGQPAYLNAAAGVRTMLTARALLEFLQAVEREHGRIREATDRWAARTLDLDLLLFDDSVIDEPGLRVPHPRMHDRVFVLAPLCEIAPEAHHPLCRRTIRELLECLQPEGGAAVIRCSDF